MSTRVRKTFLFRLLVFYAAVILVFVVFQTITYGVYMRKLEKEIAYHTEINLRASADRFSSIVSQVSDWLLSLSLCEEVASLRASEPMSMYDVYKIVQRFSSIVVKDNTPVRDAFLLKRNSRYIASAYGSYKKDLFFDIAYANRDYPLGFWEALCSGANGLSLLPCRTFSSRSDFAQTATRLMPVVLKPSSKGDYVVVALLDLDAILASIEQDAGSAVFIYGRDRLLYPEADEISPKLRAELARRRGGFISHSGQYYFSQFTRDADFLFIKAVSHRRIQDELRDVRTLAVLTLLLSIVVGSAVSVMLSLRTNKPIRRIAESIPTGALHGECQSDISELDLITQTMQELLFENTRITEGISRKNSFLKLYFYLNKLKNIHTDLDDTREYLMARRFFAVAYFMVHYRRDSSPAEGPAETWNRSEASFLVAKLVQDTASGKTLEALTFQTENDRIISVIGFDEEPFDITGLVDSIIARLDRENEGIFLTVAISDNFKGIGELGNAYRQVCDLSLLRRLDRKNQVLTPAEASACPRQFCLTHGHEQELSHFVLNGDLAKSTSLVNHILEVNCGKGVPLGYFQKLSTQLVNICVSAANMLKIDYPQDTELDSVYNEINSCYSVDEFEALFARFLSELLRQVNVSKNNDYIKDYVLTYIDEHYDEDVYLDLLSDKLGITSNYLSQYFKIKTGTYFTDYLGGFRVEKAKNLLSQSDKKVREISWAVGYRNANSFIRLFKKHTGQTPKKYRMTCGEPILS